MGGQLTIPSISGILRDLSLLVTSMAGADFQVTATNNNESNAVLRVPHYFCINELIKQCDSCKFNHVQVQCIPPYNYNARTIFYQKKPYFKVVKKHIW